MNRCVAPHMSVGIASKIGNCFVWNSHLKCLFVIGSRTMGIVRVSTIKYSDVRDMAFTESIVIA
jgi:hypothetical protein